MDEGRRLYKCVGCGATYRIECTCLRDVVCDRRRVLSDALMVDDLRQTVVMSEVAMRRYRDFLLG